LLCWIIKSAFGPGFALLEQATHIGAMFQQQIPDLERQLTTLADTYLQRNAQMVLLEAKLAELEPY